MQSEYYEMKENEMKSLLEDKEGVRKSIEEFLAKGGKITKCEPSKELKKDDRTYSMANTNIINTRSK